MNPLIQEYVDLLYEKYDKLNMTVPTGMGINNYMYNKLVEELSNKRQMVLYLCPNIVTATNEYINFCKIIDQVPEHRITSYCDFSNGSYIHFLPHNQVQKQLYDHCDVIIMHGLYTALDRLSQHFMDNIFSIEKVIAINCTLKNFDDLLFNNNTKNVKINHINDLDRIVTNLRKYKLEKIKEQL
jgi:hypothetical protein